METPPPSALVATTTCQDPRQAKPTACPPKSIVFKEKPPDKGNWINCASLPFGSHHSNRLPMKSWLQMHEDRAYQTETDMHIRRTLLHGHKDQRSPSNDQRFAITSKSSKPTLMWWQRQLSSQESMPGRWNSLIYLYHMRCHSMPNPKLQRQLSVHCGRLFP